MLPQDLTETTIKEGTHVRNVSINVTHAIPNIGNFQFNRSAGKWSMTYKGPRRDNNWARITSEQVDALREVIREYDELT